MAKLDIASKPVLNNSSVIEKDQSKLRIKGYMGTKKDWKNVEMTLYARINRAEGNKNGGQHFELLARGGPNHTDSKPCEGTALHANLYVNGRVKSEKESESHKWIYRKRSTKTECNFQSDAQVDWYERDFL